MILATEMTKHFEHLAKFMNAFSTRIPEMYIEGSQDLDLSAAILPENVILVKRMIIKCADVSNPTRPLKYCVEWARRIAEEYFSQVRIITHTFPSFLFRFLFNLTIILSRLEITVSLHV